MNKSNKAAQIPPSITLRLSRGRSVKITWQPRKRISSLLVKLLTKALAIFLPLSMSAAHALDVNALPTGGQVTAGSATINQAGNTLNINQASQKAALNWQNFNIGTNSTVNFVQPNSNAVALNRIGGNSASEIYGHLNANGQVFMMNPNGILFARGSQVNVGGIVATTMQLGDADFLAGNYNFNNAGAGSVANYGLINATNSVALLGGDVSNQGSIFATTASLVSGNTVALDVSTDGLIRARVVDVAMQANIANSGDINATQVTLSAGQAKDTLNRVVNNSGVIKATGFSSLNGEIVLQGGTTLNSGTLDATSTTGNGGTVHMLGQHVGVVDSGSINVSGATGGGTILVGGDYQGKNTSIENAEVTYVGAQTTLKADATQNGNGGKVIVWADDTTRAYGSISAQGGVLGGDGGFVETSGHRYLDINGARVNTLALHGLTGNWLLDPYDITISNTTPITNNINTNTGSGNFTASPSTITPSYILDSDIVDELTRNNVIIQTVAGGSGNGNITASGVNITSTSGHNLTLAAYSDGTSNTGNIDLTNSTIDVGGSITMLAGWNGGSTYTGADIWSGYGDITISNSTIQNASSLNLYAGNSLILSNATVTSSSNISIDAASVTSLSSTSNLIQADNSVILRTSTLTMPTGGTTISGNFVEIGPQGNDDMSIYTGSCGGCSGLQILVSDLNRVFASDTLILGRPIAETNYTGTLTVKSNTFFDDSDIQAPKLALNGYDVAIDNNASFGDSEISFGKHMDILANNNLAIDGSLYLGSNNVLLSAPNGEIVQGGASVISANGTLTANAANGIDLDGNLNNQVTTFIATNTSMNDIDFYNAGDVAFDNISNQATGGYVWVESGGGIAQYGNIDTDGGDITVYATNDIDMDPDGVRSATINNSTNLNSIYYESTEGHVKIGLLDAGLGSVGVTAGLNIIDTNGLSNNIVASSAGLSAGVRYFGGQGNIEVDTQITGDPMMQEGLDIDNSDANSTSVIKIRNTGSPLLVNAYSSDYTDTLEITNNSSIHIGHIGGAVNTTIAATGTTSDIQLGSIGCNCATLLADGKVVLDAERDVLIYDDHVNAGTGMDVTAGRDIIVTANANNASLYTASGNQNITAGRNITLTGGNSSTGAYAEIKHAGSGNQIIDFINGGTLTLTGGTGISGNRARIENASLASNNSIQKIWRSTSGSAPAIVMNGGSSGGLDSTSSNDLSNSAEIGSDFGQQVIYASTIDMAGMGGATGYAGAIISAPNQQITTTGNVTLLGGSSNGVTAGTGDQFTYTLGTTTTTYNLASPAAIGDKNTLIQTLDIGGTLTLNGGSSTSGVAMVGSLHGVATGSIKANSVTLNSSGSLAFLGSVEDIIVANTFTNVGGAITDNSPSLNAWSIWALNPTKITGCGAGTGCLANFAQYGITFGSTPAPIILGTGHGLMYSVAAPTLASAMTGAVSKPYDGNTSISLLGAIFGSITGAIYGDTVTLSGGVGTLADPNEGTAKLVTATGMSVTAVSSSATGSIPVYGYLVAPTSANIGTVEAAVITDDVLNVIAAINNGSETTSSEQDNQTKQDDDQITAPEKVLVALNFVDDPKDNKENPVETEKPKGRTLQCSVNK